MENQKIKTELIDEWDIKPTLIDIEEGIIKRDDYAHCTDIKTEFPVVDEMYINENKGTLQRELTDADILITDYHKVEIGCDIGIPENQERVSVQPNSNSNAVFEEAFSHYSRYVEIKNDELNKKNIKAAEVIGREILLDGVSHRVILKDVVVVLERLNLDAKRERGTKNSASCNQTRKPKIRTKTEHYCPYCNQNFTRRGSFDLHLWRRHSKKYPDFLVEKLKKGIFACDICNFKSSSSRSFKTHMLMHETFVENKIFKCKKCHYGSSSKWSIRRHIQSKHSNNRTAYSCRFCNKTFYKKESLVDHLLCQHGEKFDKSLKELFSMTIKHCNLCDFRVFSKGKLMQHIQTNHSDVRLTYSCRFCYKTLIKKVSLVDHLLCQHDDKFDKSLKKLLSMTIKHCNLCDFRVSSKVKLNQHMQTNHSDDRRTYSCRFCNKTLFIKVSLVDHLLCQHGYKFDKSLKKILSMTIKHCNLCDFRVYSKVKLIQHIQTNHSLDRLTYACRFCDKTLFKKVSLVDHLLRHHGDKFDNSLKTLLGHSIRHCNICDFRVHSKASLTDHVREKHSNNRPTNTCMFCDKTSFSKDCLADHLLFDHGDKFDKSLKTLLEHTIKHCKLCDFRAVSKGKLDAHMAKHDRSLVKAATDTIIFECNNCNYKAFRKGNLRSHIQKMHSNDRPTYSCRFCKRTFMCKASLAEHLLCLHGEKFDKSLKTLLEHTIKHCKLCGFRCICKDTIHSHMAKHGDTSGTDTEIFKCDNCDYKSFEPRHLRAHIRKKHSNDRLTYSCRFCNKTWFKKASLADHLLHHHGNNVEKSLDSILSQTIKRCNLCDFRTICIRKLDQHMVTHGKCPTTGSGCILETI